MKTVSIAIEPTITLRKARKGGGLQTIGGPFRSHVRLPQHLPGLRQDSGLRPASRVRLRYVAGAGPQAAVSGAPRHLPLSLVLGLFGWPDDQSGSPHHRPGPLAHEREGPPDS